MRLFIFMFLACLSYQSEALAELPVQPEVRVHYGIDMTVTNDENSNAGRLKGLGADVLVRHPMFPIGVGLRYSMLNMGADDKELLRGPAGPDNSDMTFSFNTLAILASYRIANTDSFFLGAIGTLGISSSISMEANKVKTQLKDPISYSTYSVGVEGCTHFTDKIFGGIELGYHFSKFKLGESDSNDLSEVYAKVLVGASF